MSRRETAEDSYRQKFDELGLSETFEFIRREWSMDHDKRFWCRCRSCGTEFLSYNEVFKGRASRLICPECGAASDGDVVWNRSKVCAEAVRYYADGHSVTETAEHFGVSRTQVNNAVRLRGISNGRDFWRAAAECNRQRCIEASKRRKRSPSGKTGHFYERATMYGCEYTPGITLEKLIKRDGLRCAICGEMCDLNDHSWPCRTGPMYPSVDHIIPMSKGGGHTWDNVQLAHIICNSKKGDKIEEVILHDAG